MKIRRIEHVAIAVSDMGDMTAVLRDVLGLKLDYIEDFFHTRLASRCFRWVITPSSWSRGLDQRREVQSGSPRGARASFTYVFRSKISIPRWTNFEARASNSYMTPRSLDMGSVASRLSIRRAPATSYSNWQNLLDRKPSKEPQGVTSCNCPISPSYPRFTSGLTMARTVSMKSSARGLSVRFLKVKIAVVRGAFGNSTGRAFSEGCLPGSNNAKRGSTVTKRPAAPTWLRNLSDGGRTGVRGGSIPRAGTAGTPTGL